MLKKISMILTIFLLVCTNNLFAQDVQYEQEEIDAALNRQHVYDKASLFTQSEVNKIESSIKDFIEDSFSIVDEYIELVIVTTDNTNKKSSVAYADDFYDDNGFGIGPEKTGALLLIDMDNRVCYISTSGSMIDYLYDTRIDRILDVLVLHLKGEKYYECAEHFIEKATDYIYLGIPSDHERIPDNSNEPKVKTFTPKKAIIAILGGLIIALISCLSTIRTYRTKNKEYNYPFEELGTCELTKQKDTFVNKDVLTEHIERGTSSNSSNSGSSNSSSTHKSSSGQTHGGHGRSF